MFMYFFSKKYWFIIIFPFYNEFYVFFNNLLILKMFLCYVMYYKNTTKITFTILIKVLRTKTL